MALPPDIIAAAQKYGPSVDAIAKQYGITGAALLAKLTLGESGGRKNAVSSAGARSYTQFMPGSRQIAIDKYGVDPWADADQAIHGAALHLLGKINGSKGLSGYNPGSPTYTNYILGQKVGNISGGVQPATSSSGHASSSSGHASSSSSAAAPSAGPQITDGGQAGDFTSLLGSLLTQPQQQQAPMPIAPPAFAAHPNLPKGFSPAASIAPPPQPQQDNVGQALSLVQALGATGPSVGSTEAPAAAEAPERGSIAGTVQKQRSGHFPGTRAYPLGETGKVIGTPYAGTHTLGNWQSDNAVDIGIPVGTPMLALQDGVVVKVTKHPQGSGRFAGDQITIRGKNGNEYFYGHGVANVKAGQTVSRGDVLGKTGSANGVAHLHFGQMRGDPRAHAG